MEMKVAAVRAVRTHIGPLRIVRLGFIDPLPIQPFVKGSAVVEHTVQDHLHPPLVHLFHQPDEKFIAGFQIPDVSGSLLIFLRADIVIGAFRKRIPAVLHDPPIMRIDVIIVLYVIFMIGRRYKKRVKIDHFDAKVLQVIQLIHDSLKISPVEVSDIHRSRNLIPVTDLRAGRSDVDIFSILYVICRIPVIKAVHKDLVHHGPFRPCRCREAGNNNERVIVLPVIRDPAAVEITDLLAFLDLKRILERLCPQLAFDLIVVKFIR